MGQTDPKSGDSRPKKREKLRLYKGEKLLAELKVGQKRIVVGSAPDAKIRLKKKGLPAEILILDGTTRPVVLESRLPADKVFLNGWAVSRGFFRPGDKIEFLGLTLEMVQVEARAKARPSKSAAKPRPAAQPSAAAADSTAPEAPAAARQSMDRARGRTRRRPDPVPQAAPRADNTVTESETGVVPDGTASQVQLTDFTVPESAAVPAQPTDGLTSSPKAPAPQAPAQARAQDTGLGNPFEAQMADSPASEQSQSSKLENPAWDGNTGDLESAIAAAEAEIAAMKGGGAQPGRSQSAPPAPAPPEIEIEELIPEPENTGEFPPLFEPDLENSAAQAKAAPAERPTQPVEQAEARLRGRTRPQAQPPERAEVLEPSTQPRGAKQDPTLGENDENPLGPQPQAQNPFADQAAPQPPTLRELELNEASHDLELAAAEAESSVGAKTQVTSVPPDVLDELRANAPQQPQAPRRPKTTPVERDAPRRPRVTRSGARAPVRPAVRPVQRLDVPDDDFVIRRRSPLRGVAIGLMIVVLLAGGGYLAYRMGYLADFIGSPTQVADGSDLATGDAGGNGTTRRSPSRTTRRRSTRTRRGKTDRRVARADMDETDEIPEEEGGDEPHDVHSILGDRFDTDFGGDVDVSGLESGGGGRLRAARDMDPDALASIFLDAEKPVVRKYYPELWDPAENYAGSSAEMAEGSRQIDTNRVNAKIRAKYPAIKSCLLKSGGFKGSKARVVVNFTIYPNGRVSEVSIPSSDVSGAAFRSCVVRTISAIKFPRPKDSSVVVIYPFVFSRN